MKMGNLQDATLLSKVLLLKLNENSFTLRILSFAITTTTQFSFAALYISLSGCWDSESFVQLPNSVRC